MSKDYPIDEMGNKTHQSSSLFVLYFSKSVEYVERGDLMLVKVKRLKHFKF